MQPKHEPILVLRMHIRFGASNSEVLQLDSEGNEHEITSVDSWTLPDRDDSHLRPHIADALEVGIRRVIVDLSDVIVLNSVALGELIEWREMVRSREGVMVLCNPGERVSQSLRVTRLENILPVTASLEEAQTLLNATPDR